MVTYLYLPRPVAMVTHLYLLRPVAMVTYLYLLRPAVPNVTMSPDLTCFCFPLTSVSPTIVPSFDVSVTVRVGGLCGWDYNMER